MIVECRSLTKNYGSLSVLADVSFAVSDGECVTILGRNGVGKTTLLHCLLGIEPHDSGSVFLLGQSHTIRTPSGRQKIGYVPESPVFPSGFTAATLFRFIGEIYRDWSSKAANCLAEEFAIPMTRSLRRLSKGMRAQVALVVAMSHGARLLLLDEPFGDLDPITRRKWLMAVKAHCEATGTACLYSTHVIEDVRVCSTRMMILAGCQIRVDLSRSQLASALHCTRLPVDSTRRADMLSAIGSRAVFSRSDLVVYGANREDSRRRDGDGIKGDDPVDLLGLYEIVATE